MEIIVHKHFTIRSDADVLKQYNTPIWEVEIRSDVIDSPEFESVLRCDDNFQMNPGHNSFLRGACNRTEAVADLLNESQQGFLLDLVSETPEFKSRYPRKDQYQTKTHWFADIIRDQAGFAMGPHIDNSHIMVQMVVNLLQDNTTATEFYQFNDSVPYYRAPLKRNHGVVFVNTPGAVHRIANIDQTRWILYGGLTI